MKLIEALKHLNVIEKRMGKNKDEITKYASILSIERPAFDSEVDQRKEVASRIQANIDLMAEYLKYKLNIEHTNIVTKVEIGGVQYSISSLLVIKRKLAKIMLDTYQALNTSTAQNRLLQQRGVQMPNSEIVRLYDEKDKNSALRSWQDMYDNIDSRLEVLNATIDLVEIV